MMKRQLILVVDDEPAITMTSAAILKLHGYETATADDGDIALSLARKLHPDLVLSDVVMPRMNGVELAIALREELPDIGVLLFSGNAATTDIIETARLTGHEFRLLAKPVPLEELLAAVRDSLPGTAAAA